MPALPRVGVLVERRAVEVGEAVRIVGKWPGTQSSMHAEARAVAGVDEAGEIVRRAEAAGRRKQPGRLIAPRAVERVFADRQQFDMREAHVAHIGRQRLGQLAIGEPAIAARCAASEPRCTS